MTRYASGSILKRGAAYVSKAAGMETTNTTGPVQDLGAGGVIHVEATVSAVQGTSPTLLLTIQGSNDGTNWYTVGQIGANGHSVGAVATAPSNITGTGTYRGCFACPQFVRYQSAIGGSGSPGVNYTLAIEADQAQW